MSFEIRPLNLALEIIQWRVEVRGCLVLAPRIAGREGLEFIGSCKDTETHKRRFYRETPRNEMTAGQDVEAGEGMCMYTHTHSIFIYSMCVYILYIILYIIYVYIYICVIGVCIYIHTHKLYPYIIRAYIYNK